MRYPFFFFTLFMALFPPCETKAQQRPPVFAEALQRWGALPGKAKIDSFQRTSDTYLGGQKDSLAFAKLWQEAIDYGKATGDRNWQIAGLVGFTSAESKNQRYASCIQYATEAINLSENDRTLAKWYLYSANIKANCYARLHDMPAAINSHKQAIEWAHRQHLEDEFALQYGRLHFNLGRLLHETDDHLSALNHSLIAKKYMDRSGYIGDQAIARILLGTIQKTFSAETEWRNTLRESGDLYLQLKTPVDTLNGLVRLVEATTDPAEATAMLQTARELVKGFGVPAPPQIKETYCFLLVLISETYDRPDWQAQRKAVLTEFLSFYPDEYVVEGSVILARTHLADFYLQTGNFRQARQWASRCVEEARHFGSEQLELDARRILARSAAALGDYRAAFDNQQQVEEIRQHLDKKGAPNALLQTYLSYQFEKEKEVSALKQAQERQASEAQIAQQRLLLGVGGLGLLLLGGLAFAFYRNFRLKQRAADALAAANARLETEQQLLQRANTQLRRFSGVITHDILSNLDYVLASGNRLNTYDPPKAALKEYFSTSRDTCKQLKNYCVGLLNEVQQQPQTLAPDVTNPMAAVQNTIARFDAALREAGFTVNVDQLSPSLLPPMLVEHLFQNLISNAVRYAATAPAPLLRITEEGSAPGPYRWIVEDNGPGISAEKKHTIFEPKQNTNGSVGQHVGLGLLRANLRTHGADLWAEDRDGGGTRWVIRLPVPPKNTF